MIASPTHSIWLPNKFLNYHLHPYKNCFQHLSHLYCHLHARNHHHHLLDSCDRCKGDHKPNPLTKNICGCWSISGRRFPTLIQCMPKRKWYISRQWIQLLKSKFFLNHCQGCRLLRTGRCSCSKVTINSRWRFFSPLVSHQITDFGRKLSLGPR